MNIYFSLLLDISALMMDRFRKRAVRIRNAHHIGLIGYFVLSWAIRTICAEISTALIMVRCQFSHFTYFQRRHTLPSCWSRGKYGMVVSFLRGQYYLPPTPPPPAVFGPEIKSSHRSADMAGEVEGMRRRRGGKGRIRWEERR